MNRIQAREAYEKKRYGHWDEAAGMKVPRRICHALERNSCKTFEDAAKVSRKDWLLTENFGIGGLAELEAILNRLSLQIKQNDLPHVCPLCGKPK